MVKNAAKTFETNNYKTILLPNLYQNPRFDLVEYLSRNRKQHRVKKRKTGDENSDDIAEINFETKDGVKDNEEKANVDGENKEHDETKEIESKDVISKDKEEIIVDDRELLNKTNKRSQIKRASKKVNLKRKNLTRKVRKKNYPSRCNTTSAEPQPRRVTH